MTFTIENGRNRLLLNNHATTGCLMLDTGGGGSAILLERRQMLELAGALIQHAYKLEDKRK